MDAVRGAGADCGADLILGSHPHVLQKFDYVLNSDGHKIPIIYSLGNFLADMQKIPSNRHNIILNANLLKNSNSVEIKSISYTPCTIVTSDGEDKYVIVPLTDKYNSVVCEYDQSCIMENITNSIGNLIQPQF